MDEADRNKLLSLLGERTALKDLVTRLEWAGNADCEGMSMGDPHPMHPNGHPACLVCGGLKPTQQFPNCFVDEALQHRSACEVAILLSGEE